MGTQFEVYDDGDNPGKKKKSDKGYVRRELAGILYESNVLGSKGP